MNRFFRRTTLVACTITAAVSAVLAMTAASQAALLVTATASDLIRTQNSTTYQAIDFYFTMSDGGQFLNYRLTVTSPGGAFIQDPAKAQRDRQLDSTNAANNAGDVDTYMNTVWSAASKDSDGNSASFVFNSYNPGAANPPLQTIDWSVFDTASGDGNSVTNADGTTFTAPYRLARVLVAPGQGVTWSAQLFDTNNITGQTFTGTWDTPEPASAVLLLTGLAGFMFTNRGRSLR